MSAAYLNPSESQIQRAVIKWWAHAHNSFGIADERLLFAVPNGGARNIITASILKAEGVRRGVPDLLLLSPRKGYHGLAIEMKKPGGRVDPEQRTFLPLLVREGYAVHTCYSFEEAITAITSYLKP